MPFFNTKVAIKDLYAEKKHFSQRVFIAVIFVFLAVAALAARLTDLQVIQHDYYSTRADSNRKRVVAVPPARGLIYDRNGVVLADNQPMFNLMVTRDEVEDMPTLLSKLTPLVHLKPLEIARFKDRTHRTPKYRPVLLKANLTPDEMAQFELNNFTLKGAKIVGSLSRVYPLGEVTSHIVGYVAGISEADYKNLDEVRYQGVTQIGKLGVEKSHEDDLFGMPGEKIIEANAAGRPLRELEDKLGVSGQNLFLTIDSRLQAIAERALGNLEGAVVAIDPRTGEILALVSKPGFDPQMFVDGISTINYRTLQNDPGKPMFNRSLQGTYPPGSTIKPFMSFTGFMDGKLTNDTHVNCTGSFYLPHQPRPFRCHKRTGHGSVNANTALAKSCDTFFYQLGLNLGIDRIDEVLEQFGFGSPTDLDIPHERKGLLPSRAWKLKARKEDWYPGETLNTSIGQGYWQVTPLQLAHATARLAMLGGGFKPHLVHATQDPITGKIIPVEPIALPHIGNQEGRNYATVIHSMVAVTRRGGTASKIGGAPYLIAAKTGTAQVAGLALHESAPDLRSTPKRLRDHAWFMGFAPADNPRIAVVVLAEHAGHGGTVSAPVARQVMDQYLLGKVSYSTRALGATSGSPPPPPLPTTTSANPEDFLDATDPEAGFEAPAEPVPFNIGTQTSPVPEDDSDEPEAQTSPVHSAPSQALPSKLVAPRAATEPKPRVLIPSAIHSKPKKRHHP